VTDGDGLAAGVAALGLQLEAADLQRLRAYLVLLDKWNRTHNLTAIRDPAQMITHHLLDSLAALAYVIPHVPHGGRLLDIGSGGGLPGIPLAVARPDWKVTLLDSNHKKVAFMRQAAIELPLPNVDPVAVRAEDYVPPLRFDAIISRAFSDLATFADAGRRLLAPGGRLLAMKGVYPHEEIGQLPQGVTVSAVAQLRVPGLDGTRHVVVMETIAA
jgi:16S rRNA (guanine527-N7)-methyltransferase